MRCVGRWVFGLLIVAVLLAACARTTPPKEPLSPARQQAEIKRLQIELDVKQQRIETLEHQVAERSRQINLERDRKSGLEIQQRAAQLRHLRAKRNVEMSPLTSEVLGQLIDREIGDRHAKTQFRGYEILLKHLGLIPAKLQLESFLRALYSEQVAGIYDDDTKKLYVSDKFDLKGTLAKVILAHEICHALQDQNFNLTSSPIHLKTNDDRALAALCVVEGDATVLMTDYMATIVTWRTLFEIPGMLMLDQKQLSAAPRFLSQSLLFPYLQGLAFVTQWIEKKGEGARDQLFRNYPRSTEQILHPEKYGGPEKDEPTEISLDSVSSTRFIPSKNRYNNVAGEMGIRVMLSERLSKNEAETAAAGWDGDRMVFGGQLDGSYAFAWLSIWDNDQDAREFAEALQHYFKKERHDLAAQPGEKPEVVWLADKLGLVAIARKGDIVACVHSDDPKRATRLLDALLAIKLERVP